MSKSVRILLAASVGWVPVAASADNQFATADTTYESKGDLITSSLYATANQEPENGDYIFEGFVLRIKDELAVPWTVRVPTEIDVPDIMAVQEIADDQIQLRHSYQIETPETVVEKIFFEVIGDDVGGSLVVTDDPLPIVGWLVLGAAATVLGTVGIYVTTCSRIETKTIYSLDGKVTYESSCEIPR